MMDYEGPASMADDKQALEQLDQVSVLHVYRGQITMATTWLSRMDQTTTWAVIVTSALLTFALGGSVEHPRAVLLLAALANLFLLHAEARRYRIYDVWAHRIRIIESEALAPLLMARKQAKWRHELEESLVRPRYTMSLTEAMGRRLRRTYGWLFLVVFLTYIGNLVTDPAPASDLGTVVERAQVGFVPGALVAVVVSIFYLGLLILALATTRMHEARAYMLPYEGDSP